MGFCERLEGIDRLVIKYNFNDKIIITKELVDGNYLYLVKIKNSDKKDSVMILNKLFIDEDLVTISYILVNNSYLDKIYYYNDDGTIDYSMGIFTCEPEEESKIIEDHMFVKPNEILSSNCMFNSMILDDKLNGDANSLSCYGFYIQNIKVLEKNK